MPDGYGLYSYDWRPDSGDATMRLERADGTLVGAFAASVPTDRIERAAWRDHRRRTLRIIAGGRKGA